MSTFLDFDASNSLAQTLQLLQQQEKLFLEVKGIVAGTDNGQTFNLVEVDNKTNPNLAPLQIRAIIQDAPASIDDLANDGEIIVDYSDIFVGGTATQAIVLFRQDPTHVARAGVKVVKGTISTFGGPTDKGVKPGEGLALIDRSNMAQFSSYFLPAQPPGTTGLARRLNNNGSHYLACRWNYKETPPHFLRANKVMVRLGNIAIEAQPVDWGPNADTGRVADLSDLLASELKAQTDSQIVTLEIPLPAGAAVPAAAGAAITAAGPVATKPVVFNLQQIKNKFGDFSFREDPNHRGEIIITPPFESQNIVTVHVPALVGKRIGSRLFSGDVSMHRLVAPALVGAFAEVQRQNLAGDIVSFAGSFVPRHILFNPSKELSAHSWGIAFDINEDQNGFGDTPASAGSFGSVRKLVPIFESFGFFWGGNFSTPDGMHFQFGV